MPEPKTISRRHFMGTAASAIAIAGIPRFARANHPFREEMQGYDSLGLADLVRRGEVSAVELLDNAIGNVKASNPALNYMSQEHYDIGRAAASGPLPDGPFKGVPFLLKDISQVLAGTPTRNGARFFKDYTAPTDGELVKRYKDAGLVIFGKTTTPEFGITITTESDLTGKSRNPWNPAHSTGGSSGGAAAAVAAGVIPVANASDGGGSIRIPASCCGLFGMKPSRGRMPASGGWAGLSVHHAVSRSVRDSAALLDATRGSETGSRYQATEPSRTYLSDVSRDPGKLRIAFTADSPLGGPVHEECKLAVRNAAKLCEALGHEVVEGYPAISQASAARLNSSIQAVIAIELALSYDGWAAYKGVPVTENDMEQVTWAYYMQGKAAGPGDYARAIKVFDAMAAEIAAYMRDIDVLMSPTLANPPHPLSYLSLDQMFESYTDRIMTTSPFTALFNLTGQPAMSVPLHWTPADVAAGSPKGLPVGVMFAGRLGDESTLYALAGQLEQAQPWKDRRPV